MMAMTVSYAKGLQIFKSPRKSRRGGLILTDTIFPDDDLYIICLINTEGPRRRFFADKMTWKLLDKKSTKVELDFDTKH
jgi:hypothetical protein